jgi:hypothetical protein
VTAVIPTEPAPAWCLVKGEWLEREDPVMALCDPYGGDIAAAMASLGYEAWCQIGVDRLPAVPLALAMYSREAPPLQFLVQLEGNAGNVVEHVFAETLPDAMELLAKWVPIAQAGALVELVRRHTDAPGGEVEASHASPSRRTVSAPDPGGATAMDRVGT